VFVYHGVITRDKQTILNQIPTKAISTTLFGIATVKFDEKIEGVDIANRSATSKCQSPKINKSRQI